MAYSDKVIDHYENPRNVGKMDDKDVTVGTGMEELALPPVKIHCSVLAEDAIKAAVNDFRSKQIKDEN